MKEIKTIIPIILVLIATSAVLFFAWNKNQPDENKPPASPIVLAAQTNNQGTVTVMVTPRISRGNQAWLFEVALDTHSVELKEDMVALSVLTDNGGKEYKPISWEGDSPGGHHREGILEFAPILPLPESITLIIMQVGGVEKRNFRWELTGKEKEETEVIIFSPQPNQLVDSPLRVEGKAKGTWFFEAAMPIKILDEEGRELAVSYAQALDNWMTEDFIPFSGEIRFISDKEQAGLLVLNKANPSGLAEYEEAFSLPVRLAKTEAIKIKAYFNNDRLDPEFLCNKVFPVERIIPKTSAVARAALEELLKGPTAEEKAQGFLTSLPPRVIIQRLVIDNGVARVDFNEELEFQVGGSCRVSAIRAQITQTLKQFPNIQEVIISINGRSEDILQP